MSKKKEYVCIVCPNSCRLTVEEKGGEIIVEGAGCKRGIEHGKNEYTAPKRMLTTTVAVKGGIHPRLSVVSDGEISREKMKDCLHLLYGLELTAPVAYREVIVDNIEGTGVNIIASREMRQADDRHDEKSDRR